MALPQPIKAALRYIRRVLVATDWWLNVLSGGALGESISYRCAVAERHGTRFGKCSCWLLGLFQRDHCAITYANASRDRIMGDAK